MGAYVKQYYQQGLYTDDQLKVFVQAAYITQQDYQDLTGTPYQTESTPA
jgi:hypothetical protein